MLLTENNISIIGKILFALLASIIPIIIMLIENDNDKTAKVLFLNFLCNLFWNVVAIPDINVKTAFIIEKVSGCTLNSVNIFQEICEINSSNKSYISTQNTKKS